MKNIKTNLPINIQNNIYSNYKKVVNVDEANQLQKINVITSENFDTELRPKACVLDYSAPITDVLPVKNYSSINDKLVGIIGFNQGQIPTNRKISIITKGIIQDNLLTDVALNKKVYIDNNGFLTTRLFNYNYGSIGRIINLSPILIFIDVNNELEYEQPYEYFPLLENSSQGLEFALRKLAFLNREISNEEQGLPITTNVSINDTIYDKNTKRFIGIANNNVYWSNDCKQFFSLSTPTGNWQKIYIINTNIYILVGTNSGAISNDFGVTWNTYSFTTAAVQSVCSKNMVVVAAGTRYYYTDGSNWGTSSALTFNTLSVTYSNSKNLFHFITNDVSGKLKTALNNFPITGLTPNNIFDGLSPSVIHNVNDILCVFFGNTNLFNYTFNGDVWTQNNFDDGGYIERYLTSLITNINNELLFLGYDRNISDPLVRGYYYTTNGKTWVWHSEGSGAFPLYNLPMGKDTYRGLYSLPL